MALSLVPNESFSAIAVLARRLAVFVCARAHAVITDPVHRWAGLEIEGNDAIGRARAARSDAMTAVLVGEVQAASFARLTDARGGIQQDLSFGAGTFGVQSVAGRGVEVLDVARFAAARGVDVVRGFEDVVLALGARPDCT